MKLSRYSDYLLVILLGVTLLGALVGVDSTAQVPAERPRRNPQLESISGAQNLLPNAGFECGADGWSSLGSKSAWNGDLCGLYGDIQEGGGYQGDYGLRIELGPGKTPVTYYDGSLQEGHSKTIQSTPLVANIGWVKAEVGQPYTLSAFMKADKAGVPAKLVFREGTDPRATPQPDQPGAVEVYPQEVAKIRRTALDVKLTDQWNRYTFTVVPKEPDLCIAVGPDLSASPEDSATVWIDAVQLEKGPEATAFALREPVEVGLDSERFGTIFHAGEPVRFRVNGFNASGEAATAKVEASLTDYFDKPLPKTSVIELAIPPGKHASTYLPLETPGKGYFRAHLSWQAGGVAHKRNIPLAVVVPYSGKDSPFGVNHLPSTSSQSALFKDAGVTWSRDCSFIWDQLEPKEGQLSFQNSDEHVGRSLDEGFNIMAILPVFPSAKWCSSDPKPSSLECFPPKDPGLQADFITKSIERFRDRIRYWEYLNEPLSQYSLPRPEAGVPEASFVPADYVKWLRLGYETMKKADPSCVVMGGIQYWPMTYAKEFIDAGGLKWVDIYTVHPYMYPDPPETLVKEMRGLLQLMDQSPEGRRPVWATEGGHFAADDKPWTPWVKIDGLYAASVERASEKQASDYNLRQCLILLANGVTKVFMHMGAEGEVNNGAPNMNCLWLGELGTPRKYYPALAALADLLGPAPRATGELVKPEAGTPGADSVYGYAYQCGAKAVLAAWAVEENPPIHRWRLKAPAGARVLDVMGNTGDREFVALGESPVYVTSETLSAADLAKACQLTPGL